MRYFTGTAGLTVLLVGLSSMPALAARDGDRFDFRDRPGYDRDWGRGWDWGRGRPGPVANVPEIDAASGLAAMAAVCGALAFAWERRRRLS